MKERARSRAGQALVEAALLIPMLLILMLNGVNFGLYIYAWVTVNDAARAAAEFQVDNGVAAGFQPRPNFTQIQAVVNATSSSLPGYVAGKNPAVQINKGAGCAPLTDPEPTLYTIYCADITYQFTPVFSSSNGILPLTIPNSSIERVVAMRSMQ